MLTRLPPIEIGRGSDRTLIKRGEMHPGRVFIAQGTDMISLPEDIALELAQAIQQVYGDTRRYERKLKLYRKAA